MRATYNIRVCVCMLCVCTYLYMEKLVDKLEFVLCIYWNKIKSDVDRPPPPVSHSIIGVYGYERYGNKKRMTYLISCKSIINFNARKTQLWCIRFSVTICSKLFFANHFWRAFIEVMVTKSFYGFHIGFYHRSVAGVMGWLCGLTSFFLLGLVLTLHQNRKKKLRKVQKIFVKLPVNSVDVRCTQQISSKFKFKVKFSKFQTSSANFCPI